MDDMELDYTMDEEVDPEIARLQAEAEAINAQAEVANDGEMSIEQVQEDGEVNGNDPVPGKVHIRGLDQLNTHDVEAWVKEHGQSDLFKKVQWIDDSSANLIFDNEIAASEALAALSAEEATEPLQLRRAQRLSTHPEADLQVRQSIAADVKAPRAKDRSAFYLFHKEWDPDNPDNIRPDRKRKRYDADTRAPKHRRRERTDEPFNEDLYDDAPKPSARRRTSHSPESDYRRGARIRRGEDLMAGRIGGRLRDRSASPVGDGDGRYGFSDNQPSRRTAPARRRSPPGIRGGKDNLGARDSLRKELFPDRNGRAALSNSNGTAKAHSTEPVRELLPDRLGAPYHRRQDAQDLYADEVAMAIGKYTLDGAHEVGGVYAYGAVGRRLPKEENKGATRGKDLFSRIEGGPKVESRRGRLNDALREEEDFTIKGASATPRAAEFSILGASRERAENPLIKELFPLKSGGSGGSGGRKDLFDGRIKGRGVPRHRAEDMF